jgi:biotin operon repressor
MRMNEIKLPAITKDELLGAIREGVYEAMWQMITNATSMPCHDFFDHVREGVENAMYEVGRTTPRPAQCEVSQERKRILDMLEEADGAPMSASAIAQTLGTKANNVSRLLHKLARAGMVVKKSYGRYAAH